MAYGSRGIRKLEYGSIGGVARLLCVQAADGVGFAAYDDRIRNSSRARQHRHLNTVLHAIESTRPADRTEFLKPLAT